MAKKQLSFAEKAAKKKGKGSKSVKFIKSILSEKSGHWRFKEKMVNLIGGESLDDALKRREDTFHALDMEMPVFEDEKDKKLSTDSTDTSENGQESTNDTVETNEVDEAVSEEKQTEENSVEGEVTKTEPTSQEESKTEEEISEESIQKEAEATPSDSIKTSEKDSQTPEKEESA